MKSEVPKKMELLKERGLCYPKQFIAADNAYQTHLWWLCTPFLMEETATDDKKAKFNKGAALIKLQKLTVWQINCLDLSNFYIFYYVCQ